MNKLFNTTFLYPLPRLRGRVREGALRTPPPSCPSPVERGKGRNGLAALTMLLAAFALSGCVSKILESKVAEPQVYVLRATDAGTAQVAYPVQLRVALPTAAPGLDNNRIAVLRNGNQLDYFYGARWGGTSPQVVQSFLISLLQAQQGFKGIAGDSAHIDADYTLDIDLRQFQAEYASATEAPVVHVEFSASVFELKSRKSIASLRATASIPASDNRLGAVVAAFQTATQTASISLSEQLTTTLLTTVGKTTTK